MAFIQEESRSLADRVRDLEYRARLKGRKDETKEKTKQFKWPGRWKRKFSQTKRKKFTEMILVFFLNKKNEIEPPRFMPIFDGNMIIWKNKPYMFDPRAVWRIKGMRGNPISYLIKEIDRRPIMNKEGKIVYSNAEVTNMDIEEVRARGDSTESDEFLIKAALKAQTAKGKKAMNVTVLVILGLILVGGLIWLLAS